MIVTEYQVGSGAYGVAIAGDGAVWTSLVEPGQLARIGSDGHISHIHLDEQSRPMILTAGAGASIWFSRGDGHIGRVDPDGTVTSMPVGTPGGSPYGLCIGPDGALWYTLLQADHVGRMTLDGRVEEYPVTPGSMPSMITPGPDGALWYTLNQADAIGRITTSGETTTYPLPTPGAAPVGIHANSGHLWFAEIGAGQIGRITAEGQIDEFVLADRASRPHAIGATADGGCWATLWAASSTIRLDDHGQVLEDVHFQPGAEPHGIALAPDGTPWVALEVGRVASLRAGRPPDGPRPAL